MKTSTNFLGASLVLFIVFIKPGQPTCVLESDFGFKINCAFKKSGLFRVRNLGGVKAHASIGLSLGDELGFEQSLTNLDPSRRRSVSLKNGAAPNFIGDNSPGLTDKQEKRSKQNRIMMRPMAPPNGPNQAAMDKLTSLHRQGPSTMRPIFVSGPMAGGPTTLNKVNPTVTIIEPLPLNTLPPFKPLPPKEELTLKVLSIPLSTRKESPLQVPQINDSGLRMQNSVSLRPAHNMAIKYPIHSTKKVDDYNSITGYGEDLISKFNKEDINAKIAEIASVGNITMEAVEAAIALRQQQLLNRYANVPMPTTSTTTSTTTEEPLIFQHELKPETIVTTQKHKRVPSNRKVMNAPREYYPVGYEKDFDDHFQSKVDLPETNFQCGDQKYFPGLYGDESLGCMVFHVCALTDEGLVMKSFLCPESTLFDQSIIKCNWWFYVDCKNTRRLYDTNIPVSKSYQLMKALTFFSAYNKEMQDDNQATNPEDIKGIKDAISILENQDTKPAQSGNAVNSVHIITPQSVSNSFEAQKPSPVYRGNRNSSSTGNGRMLSTKIKVSDEASDSESKQLTVTKTDMNINKSMKSSGNENTTTPASENTFERKYRRRLKLSNSTVVSSMPESVKQNESTSL